MFRVPAWLLVSRLTEEQLYEKVTGIFPCPKDMPNVKWLASDTTLEPNTLYLFYVNNSGKNELHYLIRVEKDFHVEIASLKRISTGLKAELATLRITANGYAELKAVLAQHPDHLTKSNSIFKDTVDFDNTELRFALKNLTGPRVLTPADLEGNKKIVPMTYSDFYTTADKTTGKLCIPHSTLYAIGIQRTANNVRNITSLNR